MLSIPSWLDRQGPQDRAGAAGGHPATAPAGMDGTTADRYLERIGAARPARPDAGAIRTLHLAHLRSVPFENLSIHLGQPILLEEAALVDKVVRRRRGGLCYELNGAFAALASALGYGVTLLAARMFSDGAAEPGPPFAHLVLAVEADGRPWLADVGCGDHFLHPLALDDPAPQADPAGTFRLVRAGSDLDLLRDGEPQYRVDPAPRRLADFEAMCRWQATSSSSHFTRSPVCSRATEVGRITVADRRLVRTAGGARVESALGSDAEVLEAYRRWFGVALDAVPRPPASSTIPLPHPAAPAGAG